MKSWQVIILWEQDEYVVCTRYLFGEKKHILCILLYKSYIVHTRLKSTIVLGTSYGEWPLEHFYYIFKLFIRLFLR